MQCGHCKNMLEPNRCQACNKCGKQIHIDRLGLLLWSVDGGICSSCYEKRKRK